MKAQNPFDGSLVSIAWQVGGNVLVMGAAFRSRVVNAKTGEVNMALSEPEVIREFQGFAGPKTIEDFKKNGRVVATGRYDSSRKDPAWKEVSGEAAELVRQHALVY